MAAYCTVRLVIRYLVEGEKLTILLLQGFLDVQQRYFLS